MSSILDRATGRVFLPRFSRYNLLVLDLPFSGIRAVSGCRPSLSMSECNIRRFPNLPACMPTCLIIVLPTCLHGIKLISMLVYLPTYLYTCVPTYLLVSPSACLPFAYLATYVRIYPPSCLPAYYLLSTCLPTCTSTRPTACHGSKSNTTRIRLNACGFSTCLPVYLSMRLPA